MQLIYDKRSDTYMGGNQKMGIGVFNDPNFSGGWEPRWFANVVFFDQDIINIGPNPTMKSAKEEAIEILSKLQKQFALDYDIKKELDSIG